MLKPRHNERFALYQANRPAAFCQFFAGAESLELEVVVSRATSRMLLDEDDIDNAYDSIR